MKKVFMIWTAVSFFLAGLGLLAHRSDTPAGFYAGAEPPQVEDVRGYNRAVATMWWGAALGFEAIGLILLRARQFSHIVTAVILLTAAWVFCLILCYRKIESRFKGE